MNQRYAILADRTFTPEGIRYLCYVHGPPVRRRQFYTRRRRSRFL